MIRRLVYNLTFIVLLALISPWLVTRLLRRGNWRERFGQRFGRFSPQIRQTFAQSQTIWLHAVSVGEVNLVVRLVTALSQRLPQFQLVVSTTTTTGMSELNRLLPKDVKRIYYPLDLRSWVRRSLGTVRPRALVLVEAEIWPNFLWNARELKIPLLLVNARVSEQSCRRYRQFGLVFKSLFANFDLVCCAADADADRLLQVGCRPDTIRQVGNLKFDLGRTDLNPRPEVQAVLQQVGVTPDSLVLLGGSTHPGEERVLGRVFRELRSRFPALFLVVVPRHFERASDAIRDLNELGLRVIRRSSLGPSTEPPAAATPPHERIDALVVDSTGELRSFYAHATVVFMGKSLIAQGGQNPLEPAAHGRAIVTGPHMQNFRRVMQDFRQHQAVIEVQDEAGLIQAVEDLLADPARRSHLGRRAQTVFQAGSGALQRTVDHIVSQLEISGILTNKAHSNIDSTQPDEPAASPRTPAH